MIQSKLPRKPITPNELSESKQPNEKKPTKSVVFASGTKGNDSQYFQATSQHSTETTNIPTSSNQERLDEPLCSDEQTTNSNSNQQAADETDSANRQRSKSVSNTTTRKPEFSTSMPLKKIPQKSPHYDTIPPIKPADTHESQSSIIESSREQRQQRNPYDQMPPLESTTSNKQKAPIPRERSYTVGSSTERNKPLESTNRQEKLKQPSNKDEIAVSKPPFNPYGRLIPNSNSNTQVSNDTLLHANPNSNTQVSKDTLPANISHFCDLKNGKLTVKAKTDLAPADFQNLLTYIKSSTPGDITYLNLVGVQWLSIVDKTLKVSRLERLRASVRLQPKITHLNLANSDLAKLKDSFKNEFQNKSAEQILKDDTRSIDFEHMTHINISACGLTTETVKNLLALKFSLKNVRSLNLSENNFGDDAIETLLLSPPESKNKLCPNLTTLNISKNFVGLKGTKVICYAMPYIKELNISYNNIGKFGVERIQQTFAKPNTTLKILNITFNNIEEGTISSNLTKLKMHKVEVITTNIVGTAEPTLNF